MRSYRYVLTGHMVYILRKAIEICFFPNIDIWRNQKWAVLKGAIRVRQILFV